MTADLLQACLDGDLAAAGTAIGALVPGDWLESQGVARRWLVRLREVEGAAAWGPHAIVLRNERRMIGHAGFHGPPGEYQLERWAPGGVEMGYTVFAPERRRGYAAESVAGLMDWARGQGVTNFVLSIAPANTASRAVATRLGFTGPIDQVIDEVDGPEDIWVLLDRGAGG
jgi:RimJ/RimL family protein N-acetyltransferase